MARKNDGASAKTIVNLIPKQRKKLEVTCSSQLKVASPSTARSTRRSSISFSSFWISSKEHSIPSIQYLRTSSAASARAGVTASRRPRALTHSGIGP